MITKSKQRNYNLNGIDMSSADQLFHYRSQLDLAKEVIKLLERQRNIYRMLMEKCRCDDGSDPTDRTELMNLDAKLESIYKRCDFCSLVSKDICRTKLPNSTIETSMYLLNSTTTLGIDMRAVLYNQYLSNESILKSNSINNSTIRSISSRRKRKFKCSLPKCRFSSFTEKSLIKHQLEHRREQLKSIIEPHGFTITPDDSEIIFKENKDQQCFMKQCCFPFCNYEFPLSKKSSNDIKIYTEHFQEHLTSYILYPCFNCLQMFDTKHKLEEHFQLQMICRFNSQKYSTNNFSLYDDQLDSLDVDITGKKIKSFKCKLCPDSSAYMNRRLFNLHANLLHSGIDQNDLIDDQNVIHLGSQKMNIRNETSTSTIENVSNEFTTVSNSIYCKICKKLICSDENNEDIVFQFKRDHATQAHNFDDELLFIDFMYSNSKPDQKESASLERISSNFDTDMNNIGLEVFIENNDNSNDLDPINEFLIPNPDDNDDDRQQIDDTLSQVFNEDHTYNIEPDREPGQQNEDHEDYTKNVIDILSDVVDTAVTKNHSDQYEVLFPMPKVESIQKNSDSIGDVVDPIVTADSSNSKLLLKSSHSNEYVMMDVDSVAQLLKNGDIVLTSDDTIATQDHQYPKPKIEDSHLSKEFKTISKRPFSETPILDTSKASINGKKMGEVEDTNQLKQLMNLYIYECSLCTYSFRSEKELSIHNYLGHSIASYHCPNCDYVTQDTGKYHRHELLHKKVDQSQKSSGQKSRNLFVCSICSESFETDSDLRKHMNHNHQMFRCEICQVIMPNRQILSSHMISFHRDAFIKCEYCNYKTFNEYLFESHRRKHTEYKLCPFDGCTDSFATEDSLEAHVNKFHKMIKPYECTDCKSQFHSQKNLNKHLIEKHHRFLYKCDQCDFKNNIHRNYLLHLQCHSSEKPFQCTERGCFSKFRNRYQLASHLRHKHSKVKNFKCDQAECSRMFKTKTQLKQHLKNHSTKNKSITESVTNSSTILTKKPNIQYYIFGNLNINERDNSNEQQDNCNPKRVQQKQQSDTNRNVKNTRSLMIKPALLRPSSINSTSTAILTTTISPIDENDEDD